MTVQVFEVMPDRAVVKVLGQDSQKFMQNMTTNDIIKNNYSYNYILTPQGRYLFDLFIYKVSASEYIIDIDSHLVEKFISMMLFYKLRSNIDIVASKQYSVVYSTQGIQNALFSQPDPRCERLAYRSVIKTDEIQQLAIGLRAQALYLTDKYQYTIIDGHTDLIAERSIPVEFGAAELNGISYNKGCYVGQEVISRAKYQGVVRKKVFQIKFIAHKSSAHESSIDTVDMMKVSEIAAGMKITDIDAQEIGVICSCHGHLAIALIREENYLALQNKIALVNNYVGEISIPPWR